MPLEITVNSSENKSIKDLSLSIKSNNGNISALTKTADNAFLTKIAAEDYFFLCAKAKNHNKSELTLYPDQYDCNDTIRVTMELDPTRFRPAAKRSFDNVYFEFDKSNLTTSAKKKVKRLAKYLKKNPDKRVWVAAHTDAFGTNAYNNKLSNERALAVKAYLKIKGVTDEQIIVQSHGENHLVNDCDRPRQCSDSENALNRRAEIIIVNKDEDMAYRSNDYSRNLEQ
ncbi:MAG: OmpA family protein [Flavobacteriales bacterium]|nr:OmpA family protein [Flavobacteriales bacterium]